MLVPVEIKGKSFQVIPEDILIGQETPEYRNSEKKYFGQISLIDIESTFAFLKSIKGNETIAIKIGDLELNDVVLLFYSFHTNKIVATFEYN